MGIQQSLTGYQQTIAMANRCKKKKREMELVDGRKEKKRQDRLCSNGDNPLLSLRVRVWLKTNRGVNHHREAKSLNRDESD